MGWTIDGAPYAAWHGITPMTDFFRDSDPGMLLTSGEGCHVVDEAGRRYLDARSSMWNVTLGYSCEPVKEAMCRQLAALPSGTVMRYEHPTAVAARYAARLAAVMPPAAQWYIRFGNTGSQMTEAAAMLSRFHRRMTGEQDRTTVLAFHHGYHGTGPLASALTGDPILHDYSAPLDGHVRHVGTPTVEAAAAAIDEAGAEHVTAVILEPVLGSCITAAPLPFLEAVLALCRDRGIHVILDEVTTGAGRAGSMTIAERLATPPDMIVLGKGLSSGYFPLAALAVTSPLYDALADPAGLRLGFPNGSTTDGHPVGMAAGLAVLDVLTADGFLAGVRETSSYLRQTLAAALADVPEAGGIVGEGLLLGVELVRDGEQWPLREINQLRLVCASHGLLVSYAVGSLALLPPLVITRAECDELAERLGKALRDHLSSAG